MLPPPCKISLGTKKIGAHACTRTHRWTRKRNLDVSVAESVPTWRAWAETKAGLQPMSRGDDPSPLATGCRPCSLQGPASWALRSHVASGPSAQGDSQTLLPTEARGPGTGRDAGLPGTEVTSRHARLPRAQWPSSPKDGTTDQQSETKQSKEDAVLSLQAAALSQQLNPTGVPRGGPDRCRLGKRTLGLHGVHPVKSLATLLELSLEWRQVLKEPGSLSTSSNKAPSASLGRTNPRGPLECLSFHWIRFSKTNTSPYSWVFLASGFLLGTEYFSTKSNNKRLYEEIVWLYTCAHCILPSTKITIIQSVLHRKTWRGF